MSQQAHEGCEVEEQVAERMRKGRTGVGMEGEGQQHEEQSNGGKGGQVVDVVDKGVRLNVRCRRRRGQCVVPCQVQDQDICC